MQFFSVAILVGKVGTFSLRNRFARCSCFSRSALLGSTVLAKAIFPSVYSCVQYTSVSSGKFASFFRTHPPVEDRIVKVQEEIGFLPVKDEYVVTTSEFDNVKQRLIAIDNKLMAPGAAGSAGPTKRPTLKRKTNTDRSEREEPELKDDRPTLKRPTLKKKGEDDNP